MHRATASVAMSSVVPTGAVAGVGARRLPTPRDAPEGRRSVLVRSGKRAGRGSKFSRESLIVTSEKKRDKAYGYAYGYAYGWDYGHDYGDPDWGHVTGVLSTPEARAEVFVARPEDVDSPSRQVDSFVAAEETPLEEEASAASEPPAPAKPLAPVQPLPPPPTPRPAAAAPRPPSPREVARQLNSADAKTPTGSFTYRSRPDGTLSKTAEFRAPPIGASHRMNLLRTAPAVQVHLRVTLHLISVFRCYRGIIVAYWKHTLGTTWSKECAAHC